ncbi:hypothetical protein GCM10009734_93490 [Nonomuraea bangladeshensis]
MLAGVWVSFEVAAARAGVDRATVGRWVNAGRLRCLVVDASSGLPRERRRGEAGGLVNVRELLEVELVMRGRRGRPGPRVKGLR